mgnify:CR=1 FL=1
MEKAEIDKLVEDVRQIAYQVHVYLGNGYLERVYENCLRHRLVKADYKVEPQKRLEVRDVDGYLIGEYFADADETAHLTCTLLCEDVLHLVNITLQRLDAIFYTSRE